MSEIDQDAAAGQSTRVLAAPELWGPLDINRASHHLAALALVKRMVDGWFSMTEKEFDKWLEDAKALLPKESE